MFIPIRSSHAVHTREFGVGGFSSTRDHLLPMIINYYHCSVHMPHRPTALICHRSTVVDSHHRRRRRCRRNNRPSVAVVVVITNNRLSPSSPSSLSAKLFLSHPPTLCACVTITQYFNEYLVSRLYRSSLSYGNRTLYNFRNSKERLPIDYGKLLIRGSHIRTASSMSSLMSSSFHKSKAGCPLCKKEKDIPDLYISNLRFPPAALSINTSERYRSSDSVPTSEDAVCCPLSNGLSVVD
ncbi:hypothetical protein AGLY_011250 [Aphis glycines]|uniref:Uncharacterized protein n=1 Tax=Aphis glycines TaxID=307491 RepID=A0A6G0TDI1_APHGL|nr:hypothetical protein AGLY_011250 [Aphis glycines]